MQVSLGCTGRNFSISVCGRGRGAHDGPLEPGNRKGAGLVTEGRDSGQLRASRRLSARRESVDFQAARANCRLDSAQVLMGPGPGQPGGQKQREGGQPARAGVGRDTERAGTNRTRREREQGSEAPQVRGSRRLVSTGPRLHPAAQPERGRALAGRLQARQCGSVVHQG